MIKISDEIIKSKLHEIKTNKFIHINESSKVKSYCMFLVKKDLAKLIPKKIIINNNITEDELYNLYVHFNMRDNNNYYKEKEYLNNFIR